MAEYGYMDSISTTMIKIFGYLGLAYDLKTASPNIVYQHMKRHGDETGKESYLEKLNKRNNAHKEIMATID